MTQIARHSRVREGYPGPMERVAWTDERLDDLSRRMDAGSTGSIATCVGPPSGPSD